MVRRFALASLSLATWVACGGTRAVVDASGDGGPLPAPLDASAEGGGRADDAGAESLATSFVFTGCNRVQGGDWDVNLNPSSANLPQLQRTFADVAALADTPKLFFFTGDLVLGLRKGSAELAGQLEGWAAVYEADPIAKKVPLVPLVGNHEVLYTDKASGNELSNDKADATWTQWISAHGFDAHAGNGPTNAPPNADALQDDQSKLSYSFDDGANHFVVLNTDTWTTTPAPATGSTAIGWIALAWLEADLAAAQAKAGIAHVFVFGHKPIVAPSGSTSADEAVNPALAANVAALLDRTPKVRGYFCAHAHEWDARKLPGKRGVYQIVAGNGGSKLETKWKDPYYGFTEARVYTSGRVGIVSYGRPVPTPYTASPAFAASPAPERTIAP